MKRFIPFFAFAFLTGLIASIGKPVIAGGCSSHMNKKAEIKCDEDDTVCQTEKVDKFDLKDSQIQNSD